MVEAGFAGEVVAWVVAGADGEVAVEGQGEAAVEVGKEVGVEGREDGDGGEGGVGGRQCGKDGARGFVALNEKGGVAEGGLKGAVLG